MLKILPGAFQRLSAGLSGIGLTMAVTLLCHAALDDSRPASSFANEWAVERFTVKDGLPQLDSQAITKSLDGTIWVATMNGLSRFDGFRFLMVPRTPDENGGSLSTTFLAAGEEGQILAGTLGRLRLISATGCKYPVKEALRPEETAQIGVPLTGNKWFLSTSERWILATVLESESEIRLEIQKFEEWGSDRPTTALKINSDEVAVRFESGKWKELEPATGAWADRENKYSEREALIQAGLKVLPHPLSMFSESPESLWLGGRGEGLVHIYRPSIRLIGKKNGLLSDDVWSVDPRADGSIWIGTKASVELWSSALRPIFQYPLFFPKPRSVLGIDKASVLFTEGDRVYRLSTNGNVSLELVGKEGKNFRFVSRGESGSLWAGGDGGAYRQADGNGWQEVRLPPVKSKLGWVYALEGVDGLWWCGSLSSGAVEHSQRGEVHWTKKNGAPSDSLAPLAFDPQGGVWFGSTEGLIRYHAGRWTQWQRPNGIANDIVMGLAPDSGWSSLWLQQPSGLEVVSIPDAMWSIKASLQHLDTSRFFPHDSKPVELNGGHPRSLARDCFGRVAAATSAGLLLTAPQSRPSTVPRLMSAETKTGELRPSGVGTRHAMIRIPQDSNGLVIFQIGFSQQYGDFTVQLKGRLDGVDQDWVQIEPDRRMRYSNLPSGEHLLHLAAIGTWGRIESSTKVTVDPRWNERVEVRAAAAASGMVFSVISFWYIRKRIRTRLKLQNRRRMDSIRWQIARDLHDSVGTGLARISMLTFRSDPFLAAEAQRLIRDLEQSVWVMNPLHDSLISTVEFIAQDVRLLLSRSQIEICTEITDLPEDVMVIGYVRRSLLLAVRGILANTLSHSNAKRARFSISAEANTLRFRLEDNGVGFEPSAAAKRHRGLEMIRSRVEALEGRLEILSSPGHGTTVTFDIPFPSLEKMPPDCEPL